MSGGTDSSVAALLLQDAGYEVTGITFRFYEKGNECPPAENASRICVGSNDRGVGLVASYSGH